MNSAVKNLARMIDLSAVQAQNTKADIDAVADLAKKYNIISIHVLPNWASYLREQLPEGGDIYIGGPIGFPSGGHATSTKVAEVHQLIADGAREVDMVVNIGRVLSGDYDYIRKELSAVVQAAHPVKAKVIVETHYMNEEQLRTLSDIAVDCGMAWVKTATGWTPTGATRENVAIIADQLKGRIGIKASGGIRDLELIKDLYALGVRRFGLSISTTKKVLEQLEENPELFPELNT